MKRQLLTLLALPLLISCQACFGAMSKPSPSSRARFASSASCGDGTVRDLETMKPAKGWDALLAEFPADDDSDCVWRAKKFHTFVLNPELLPEGPITTLILNLTEKYFSGEPPLALRVSAEEQQYLYLKVITINSLLQYRDKSDELLTALKSLLGKATNLCRSPYNLLPDDITEAVLRDIEVKAAPSPSSSTSYDSSNDSSSSDSSSDAEGAPRGFFPGEDDFWS